MSVQVAFNSSVCVDVVVMSLFLLQRETHAAKKPETYAAEKKPHTQHNINIAALLDTEQSLSSVTCALLDRELSVASFNANTHRHTHKERPSHQTV